MSQTGYEKLLEEYFKEGVDTFLPQVSINCVVFKYEHPKLKVMFHAIPFMPELLLPGGYVKKEESLEEAAYRNLSYSGVDKVFLRQVQTFGEVNRITSSSFPSTTDSTVSEFLEWASQRFITVVYYGLVNELNSPLQDKGLFSELVWLDVDQLDKIAMDHAHITQETKRILANEILSQPIASSLMEETFTLNELRGLFEVIMERNIDRGTFRRKMLQLGIVEEANEKKDTKGRPSLLYRFNQVQYEKVLKEQTKFGF